MIETINHMINDCTTNEQKAFVVKETYEPVCSELANTIKTKDTIGMAAIIEVMAEMMPYMTQEMAAKMPNMMMAALALVKSQSKEIEKEYTDKDMDEALQEEMGQEMEEVEEVIVLLFRAYNILRRSSRWQTECRPSSSLKLSSLLTISSNDVNNSIYLWVLAWYE